jgi:hypothetical protein
MGGSRKGRGSIEAKAEGRVQKSESGEILRQSSRVESLNRSRRREEAEGVPIQEIRLLTSAATSSPEVIPGWRFGRGGCGG